MISGQDDERLVASLLVIITMFVLVNVNPDIGLIYGFFAFTYFITLGSNNYNEINVMNRHTSITRSAFIGGIFLLIWIAIAGFILNAAESMSFAVVDSGVFQFLYTQTQIPVVSAELVTRVSIFGVMIPIIETLFVSFVIVFFAKLFKMNEIRYRKNFIKVLYVAALVGSTFSLFHSKVRLVEDTALFIDFLFFGLTTIMIFMHPQLEKLAGGKTDGKPSLLPAAFFHIFVNSGVILYGAGVL